MNFSEKSREEMLKSMDSMFSGKTNPLLLAAIKKFLPDLHFAPVVKWIPEQAEDIYWIMIDVSHIAMIEIPRHSIKLTDIEIEIIGVKEYKKQSTSKESRRKLETAINLMNENSRKITNNANNKQTDSKH